MTIEVIWQCYGGARSTTNIYLTLIVVMWTFIEGAGNVDSKVAVVRKRSELSVETVRSMVPALEVGYPMVTHMK